MLIILRNLNAIGGTLPSVFPQRLSAAIWTWKSSAFSDGRFDVIDGGVHTSSIPHCNRPIFPDRRNWPYQQISDLINLAVAEHGGVQLAYLFPGGTVSDVIWRGLLTQQFITGHP
jgi:hypothetical protein